MHVPQIEMSPNGPGMSRIAIGFWRLMEWKFTPSEIVKLVEQSLELGITTTDHASIYGGYRCEKEFGKALQLAPGLRDKIQIVTKCGIETRCEAKPQNALGHYDTRTAVIIETAERSLQNFGIDCIDLLLVHRPDPLMDADAVAEAFMHLRQEGKVLHFGVSNFTPWQFNLLQSRLDFPLVTNQVEISPLEFEVMHDGTLDQCQQLRIVPQAWSPFAGGAFFTGKSEQAIRVRDECNKIAQEIGTDGIDQVALAWLLEHPARIQPVLGTGKIERIKSAARACSLDLSRQQWFRIWVASKGHGVP
ncbi:aldo/keto reductase family oxidoreductase [candidate division KSB1 bacterium]|nr:aldo/keto reductase family oxidoreductase [candidate division KSB1 bacterium]